MSALFLIDDFDVLHTAANKLITNRQLLQLKIDKNRFLSFS